jgi:hypothetical protein
VIDKEPEGQKLDPGAAFRFACHPGLACFNSCCTGKRLPVLPYDLLRLRLALGMTSQDILASYIELEEDPVSGWPTLRLKLTDQDRCPFVGDQGCGVYAHRPAACRLYPLSRAVSPAQGRRPAHEVFLRLTTSGCLGWEQPREMTVPQWLLDQDLAPYNQANDRLLPLLLHPARQGRVSLDQRQTHGVILALYNLDVFRPMLAQPGLAARWGLDTEQARAAQGDDLALLGLGQTWLTRQLFGGR